MHQASNNLTAWLTLRQHGYALISCTLNVQALVEVLPTLHAHNSPNKMFPALVIARRTGHPTRQQQRNRHDTTAKTTIYAFDTNSIIPARPLDDRFVRDASTGVPLSGSLTGKSGGRNPRTVMVLEAMICHRKYHIPTKIIAETDGLARHDGGPRK